MLSTRALGGPLVTRGVASQRDERRAQPGWQRRSSTDTQPGHPPRRAALSHRRHRCLLRQNVTETDEGWEVWRGCCRIDEPSDGAA